MAHDLSRLLSPSSVAIVGGGFWADAVAAQCAKMGFEGPVWPVHPSRDSIGGFGAFRRLSDLPGTPDAAFVAVNREKTIGVVEELSRMGAGGAVCFAAGFREAGMEDSGAAALQDRLVEASGAMPFLGPNCYGFINYLDRALLWPDQHGGARVDRGVAIVSQSSNIAISLTMQRRALPVSHVVCVGNQAKCGFSDIGLSLLEDSRVTALGLVVEGFGDIQAFERLCLRAHELGKPIAAIKSGRSEQARQATFSHTASLAGGDAGAQALLERLGVARVDSLPALLETLKLLHVCGPLESRRIGCISCSGGEASLAADSGKRLGVEFPPLGPAQSSALREALGPLVALANPLDYNTYIWKDAEAMSRAWTAMHSPELSLLVSIVDLPRSDRCDDSDWECAVSAALAARSRSGRNVAVVSTLPECMPEHVAERLLAGGVAPIAGLDEAFLAAVAASGAARPSACLPALPAPGDPPGPVHSLDEIEAKARLAEFGVASPISKSASTPVEAAAAAARIGFPVALKGMGAEHKSEAGLVALGLGSSEDVRAAAARMAASRFLVERMILDCPVELIVGVVRDPAHGFVLTVGAGGVLAELIRDSVSLLVPSSRPAMAAALDRLAASALLDGYRGLPPVDRGSILRALEGVQDYVLANRRLLSEIEINPLLCGPSRAVAADALLREAAPGA